jgi:hypothetical protein
VQRKPSRTPLFRRLWPQIRTRRRGNGAREPPSCAAFLRAYCSQYESEMPTFCPESGFANAQKQTPNFCGLYPKSAQEDV